MAKTYNEIYINTRKQLKNAGIEACELEARLLVAHAAGKTVAQLTRDLPLYAGAGLEKDIQTMTERRLAGEPVAYITGSWEFYGVELAVTRDVLIPRPDTEVMVKAAIDLFAGKNGRPRILDLCAGSGCIGCALAVHMPGATVILVDNDRKALSLCRKNVEKNNLGARVMCVEADAAQKPPMLLGKFDLAVCNAPYIPTGEIESLDPSVRDYEPYAALDGGEDGLAVIRPVIARWSSVLKPGGTLMLEIGEGQAPAVMTLMQQAGYGDIQALEDTGGTPRVIAGHL